MLPVVVLEERITPTNSPVNAELLAVSRTWPVQNVDMQDKGCLGRNLNCHYEPHTKTHKDDLLKEIKTLRSDNTRLLDQNKQQSNATSDLAERHRGLQISYDWQRIILDAVGSNGHDREIIQRLRAGDSIQSVADWLCQQDPISTSLNKVPPSQRSLVDIVQSFDNHYRQQQSFRSSTGITYQKLYAPGLPHIDRLSGIQMDRDDVLWRFYRRTGDEKDLPFRPGHALMTASYQAALFRIIHESIDLYCGLRGLVTAEAVLKVYRWYIDWETDLNPILNNVDVSIQPLPHFHTAVIQHINPMLECGHFTGENLERLREIVVYHAQGAIETLEHYRQLYSTRYLMPLMAFCIVHVGDALVRHSPNQPPAADVVEFCLRLLDEAGVGFPICGPLQELFRRTAVECNVPMPKTVDHTGRYGMDDILDACTRLDYKQPLDQSVRHVDSRVAQDWPEVWEAVVNSPERPEALASSRRYSKGDSVLPIDSLLNQ
ncbi:MAG: hypothetical protein Q9167_007452 [Letrouitia subvulpina]